MAHQPQRQKHALSDAQAAALAKIVADGGAWLSSVIGDQLVDRRLAYSVMGQPYYRATAAGRRMDEARRAAARRKK